MAQAFTQAAPYKAAFSDICATLFAGQDVGVYYGTPDNVQGQVLISLGAVRSAQEWATIARSLQPRNENLEIDIDFYAAVGGGSEVEQDALEQSYSLLAQLEQYIRTVDGDLSIATGVPQFAIWCRLLGHVTPGKTDPNEMWAGRATAVTATFGAQVRIRNS